MLDVSVWTTRCRVAPHIIIRLLASAEFEEYLANIRIHVDHSRPTAFCLVENDQVPEKIDLSNFEIQLLALTGTGTDRKRNHRCQMLPFSGALSQQERLLIRQQIPVPLILQFEFAVLSTD